MLTNACLLDFLTSDNIAVFCLSVPLGSPISSMTKLNVHIAV